MATSHSTCGTLSPQASATSVQALSAAWLASAGDPPSSERYLDPAQHLVGKQYRQTIESTHINLRTRIKRLVRRTVCFSKTTTMHDLVIGLFMNRYEFGVAI
jgi:IS1 family transposase